MHILFATLGYKPAYRLGGPIHSVSAKAEELARRGHRVTVFATDSNLHERLPVPVDRPVDVQGVEVWYFRHEAYLKALFPRLPYVAKATGFLYAPRMAVELRRLVPRVDLVHTHLPFIYPTLAAGRAALRFGKPLFCHQRGLFDPARLDFRALKKRLYLAAFEKPLLRGATTLFALTGEEAVNYRRLGIRTPCRVLPNGVDVDRYRQRPEEGFEARWGIPSDAVVLLFLARLHPIKGADILLEAFLRVARAHPKAVLVMAGPDEWGMMETLRARAASAGLADRVVFPGLVQDERKVDLLARADLFCLPSVAEGFSMAVLEAMASRTAVLLSPGCYFPDVQSAGAGRVCDNRTDALEVELKALLGDVPRLSSMGDAALRLVRSTYTWRKVVDGLLEGYEEGMARRRSRGGA